jgi:hypothetical protein
MNPIDIATILVPTCVRGTGQRAKHSCVISRDCSLALLLVTVTSAIGAGCDSPTSPGDQGRTLQSNIYSGSSVSNDAVFGFETAGTWSTTMTGATLAQSTTHSQGSYSLSVRPSNSNGYTPLASTPLSTLSTVGPTLAVDVMLPKNQANPYWYGTMQVYLNCPSRSIYSQFLGQVELTGKPLGVWNTVSFSVNSGYISSLLSAKYSDLVITVVLNVQVPTAATYYIDNLRFLPAAVNGCNGLPNGTSCTDNNACSVGDACQSNTCRPGPVGTCVALDQCHAVGTCAPSTGLCSNPVKANGTNCDDGNTLTQGDVCTDGVCKGSTASKPNGVACTGNSDCMSGNCVGGICCNSGCNGPCQSCSTGTCTNKASGVTCGESTCSGGILTTAPTCDGMGTCTAGVTMSCSAANGQEACVAGQCVLTSCNPGFANCNGNPQDGCETNIATDKVHCGGCSLACVGANGQESCVGGQCVISTCNPGFADCDGITQNGCEANIATDKVHCGGCNLACVGANGQESCVGGQCVISTCNPGFADCDGITQNGCEANIATDKVHCGGCNLACVGANGQESCVGGQCVIGTCNPGFADCDGITQNGCEANIATDKVHCGGCNLACVGANGQESCVGGQCVIGTCNPGFADCDGITQNGCEANIATDKVHCGGCNLACVGANGQESCVGGQCVISTCNPGFADCDGITQNGCEANIATDKVNCGGCNLACVGANGQESCVGGQCVIGM